MAEPSINEPKRWLPSVFGEWREWRWDSNACEACRVNDADLLFNRCSDTH
jgi:hypothetical protein